METINVLGKDVKEIRKIVAEKMSALDNETEISFWYGVLSALFQIQSSYPNKPYKVIGNQIEGALCPRIFHYTNEIPERENQGRFDIEVYQLKESPSYCLAGSCVLFDAGKRYSFLWLLSY